MAEYTIFAEHPIANVVEGIGYSVSSGRRLFQTLLAAIGLFIGLLLSTQPRYSFEMIMAGVGYWDQMIISLWRLMLASESVLGLVTIAWYVGFGGVTLHVIISKLWMYQSKSAKGVLTFLPGALAAGCAGCGAGLVGLVAGVGALGTIPFSPSTIRIAGIVLFVYYLSLEGHPLQCRVES